MPLPDRSAGNTRGIAFMLLAMACFVCNDALVKTASKELPLGEIIAIRGFICVVLTAIPAWRLGQLADIRSAYSWPLVLRNVGEIFTTPLYLAALFRLPFANCTAILQSTPLVMTAASALLLGERVGWRRWLATLAGLAGALLIVQPGTADFSWWYLSAFAAVFFVTMRDLSTRYIPMTVPTLLLVLITSVFGMLTGLALGPFETWVAPSLGALARIALAALFLLGGYTTLTIAMRSGEVSAIAPFRYSIVVWAAAIGFLVWSEVPPLTTFLGSALVIAAGVYTFRREQLRARAARAEAAAGSSGTAAAG